MSPEPSEEADEFADAIIELRAGFALSMRLENKYRRNEYVDRWFAGFPRRNISHFYHVGSTENLRNAVTEAVILSENAVADIPRSSVSSYPLSRETAETVNI